MDKFIKCFSQDVCDVLVNRGCEFMFESNGIYMLKTPKDIAINFSDVEVKFTDTIGL